MIDGYDLHSMAMAYQRMQGINSARRIDAYSSYKFLGYVQGVYDCSPLIQAHIPDESTIDDILALVTAYLVAFPDRLGEPASGLIMAAVLSTHPCPKDSLPKHD